MEQLASLLYRPYTIRVPKKHVLRSSFVLNYNQARAEYMKLRSSSSTGSSFQSMQYNCLDSFRLPVNRYTRYLHGMLEECLNGVAQSADLVSS
jgi:hypothetical protein